MHGSSSGTFESEEAANAGIEWRDVRVVRSVSGDPIPDEEKRIVKNREIQLPAEAGKQVQLGMEG